MSGCIEHRTPDGYLIESDGHVNTHDQKLDKFQQEAIDSTYRCNLQSGVYTVDIQYTSQLDDLLKEFYEDPTDYTNMRISNFTRVEIDETGKVTNCRLVITGNHIENKALTVLSIQYRKPKAVGTIDSGLRHAEVEPPHLIFGKHMYTLQPNAKGDKSIYDESQRYYSDHIPENRIYNDYNLVSENMIFMDDIIKIIIKHNIPYRSRDQAFGVRDFTNIYPNLEIYENIDGKWSSDRITGWLAVIDKEIVGGELILHTTQGDTREFRGLITVGRPIDDKRRELLFNLIK